MTRDVVYLRHILDAMAKIEQYVDVSQEQCLSDSLRQDAAIRQLEIVGEATKRLSPVFRQAHPEFPWRLMAGMRDVLAYSYDDVDLAIVWNVTQRSIPDLKPMIETLLEDIRSTDVG